MRVSFLSTYDNSGGAAIAALRLHDGLMRSGIDVQMYAQRIKSNHAKLASPCPVTDSRLLILRKYLDNTPVYLYKNRSRDLFSPAWLPMGIRRSIIEDKHHILHLHWINFGFLSIKTIGKFKAPIVWTMHDMWPFTGGCHYDSDCGRYRSFCGKCPILGSNKEDDLSNRILKKKINHWDNIDLTLVSPSHWLANCARESSVFRHNRIEVIPNGIDTDKYRPIEKKYARRQLGLPLEKNLILFGAQRATGDSRKGFDLLEEAVTRLSTENHQHRTEIVIYGTNNKSKIEKNNIKRHYIGKIDNEKKLVTLYSAADVFVAPSRQDNLPNTVMEALACGTACAAFDIGGMPDMIEHKKNGYLATPYDPADLANGIRWVLSDADRLDRLEHAARKKVLDEFDINLISKRYIDLYQSCLAP